MAVVKPKILTRRVAAATFIPTNSATTFNNHQQETQRYVLRSVDALSKWFFPISDVAQGDRFTKLTLNAARLDNSGNFSVTLTLVRCDDVGVSQRIGPLVSSTSIDGIASSDSADISATGEVSPVVDLKAFTYLLTLTLQDTSGTPSLGDIVVPWVEYSVAKAT